MKIKKFCGGIISPLDPKIKLFLLKIKLYFLNKLNFIIMKKVTAISTNSERGIISGNVYSVERETPFKYYLQGRSGVFDKSNFIDEGFIAPKTAGTNQMFVKCNTKSPYKNITVGKEYKLVKNEKEGNTEFLVIINDSGNEAKYNKKFFTSLYSRASNNSEATPQKPKEPVIPKGYAMCVEEGLGLTKGKMYKVVSKNTNSVTIIDETTKKEGKFLSKRFKFAS